MPTVTWRDRIQYAFDNAMSRGPIALIGWLALASVLVVLVVTLIVWFGGIAAERSFLDQLWDFMIRTLDTEPVAPTPWPFRLATLVIILTGILVMSTLIGVLTTSIEEKLHELRKGRSRVIETGHTVVLGWSPQVFPIISELVIANENQPKSAIVILGDEDKVEMEDQIRTKVGSTGRTRVVCRTGSPVEMADLGITSLHSAKSIIILRPPDDDDPDSSVIKTLLAIVNQPDRAPQPYHIVASIQDPQNMEVAQMVGCAEVELVLTGELIARVTAQTSRQSGLSVVYTEFLDFAGDEIYFQAEPALVGKTFGEALLAYENSAVMGLCSAESGPRLNPPMDTVIGDGDDIIAISEDDDTVVLSGRRPEDLGIDGAAIRQTLAVPCTEEHLLLLGWNRRAATIIRELDHYLSPCSTTTVVAALEDGESVVRQLGEGLENQTLAFRPGDITNRRTLDSLPIEGIDHVILLACCDDLDPQHADARTLITLLHLRDIAQKEDLRFSIVSEILDIRNRDLVQVTRADDFVVSDRLVSLMLAQVSENKALGAVFADLFDPDGSEVYLKPAKDYVALGQPVNFYTVIEAARRSSEVALGYRLHADADNPDKDFGVAVNPAKSARAVFGERDRIVVLAEE